jgi:hypothetical protein
MRGGTEPATRADSRQLKGLMNSQSQRDITAWPRRKSQDPAGGEQYSGGLTTHRCWVMGQRHLPKSQWNISNNPGARIHCRQDSSHVMYVHNLASRLSTVAALTLQAPLMCAALGHPPKAA